MVEGGFIAIKTALISVYDKQGLLDFAKSLEMLNIEIIASSGTADFLRKAKLKVTDVSSLTGFPEMLEGRVKTLHPVIHAGILVKREKKHLEALQKQGIKPIDLVVVNLYPFKENLSKNLSLKEMIEFIDIGGITLIRAAAKNLEHVAVLTNPKQYSKVLKELKELKTIKKETREQLAAEAFALTAEYDSLIASFFRTKLTKEKFPEKLSFAFEKVDNLRYGENPHQKAAVYKELNLKKNSVIAARILQGKKMSFNNYLDADVAINIVCEFNEPAAVIIKHNNPCGVAVDKDIVSAFSKALSSDEISAFGGIIAVNRTCNKELADKITSFFNEIVIAPEFEKNALEVFKKKQNIRLLELKALNQKSRVTGIDFKVIDSGLLIQEKDTFSENEKDFKVVTKKEPTKTEFEDLIFAWKISKHVKSNAIVLAKNKTTVGIGAGQTSRIDSLEIAIKKAKGREKNAVLASDGFFPFRDSIDVAGKAGITAVIQPGGSVRDKEVIQAADEKGIAMLFTGTRHFKH